MKRYTIRLHLLDETSDVSHLRKALADLFSSSTCLTNIARVESDNETYRIEVESEAGRHDLVKSLKSLETKLGASSLAVEWGWGTAGSAIAVSELQRGDIFYSVEPQMVDVKEYRGGSWWLAIPLVFFLIWIGLVVVGRMPASILCFMIPAAALGIGVFLYLHGPILIAAGFRCDRKGLAIRPLLEPPIFLPWDDICGIKLRGYHGLSCRIQTCSPSPSKVFLVDPASEGPALVKTIIERASLRFVENSGLTDDALKPSYYPARLILGHAIYRRFDAK